MSRATKWKIEKAKVKVVLRLQFHATHIPQSGWEKLFISFIPTETGKATAKTSKANVNNGSCKWADPIYETTRLLVDSKTKQYDDKLYKLVVGMGTSRSSILGEATLNLSDYADASQPSAIALPLHGSEHGTVLHVTVQLLTAKTGFREFEQQRDKGLKRETEPSTAKSSSSDLQIPDDLVNKAKTRIQLREETNFHEEYSDSQVTCDESSNTSESYFIDKNDSPSNHEKLDAFDHAKLDDDVAVVYEENLRLRGSLEVAESSISELKMELTVLQNIANEMRTETVNLTQEFATEIASSQELVKEVTVLKSECLKFKQDFQKLKEMKSNSKFIEIEKTEHEKDLKFVNGVALVEDKILEIQEKILIGFCESDLSFLNSDLEMLLGTVQDLKKETVEPDSMLHFREIPSLPLQESDTEKAEREILVKKMDQMESYYESLVQELEEKQKRILGEFETVKNEMNDLNSVNNELQKRATISESALKRARLNYSIAVSQLQKDLDILSFQVLSMFETNQTVIKESFLDTSQPVSKHISDDLKKSLSLQENIYKKVEEELSEMCWANVELNVYSGTLEGTLFEASDYIRKTNDKLQELAQKIKILNQSRDVLFEDVRALNDENAYYLSKCNDLHVQNQMLEKDLGNVSNENFLLMEKITECEALLMEYKVYKSKHEFVSVEKLNLEKELESLKSENGDVKRKFKSGLAKLEIPNVCLENLEVKLDFVAKTFISGFKLEERNLENNEAVLTYLSSLELELQKISSQDKNFHEQIMGLNTMIEEFEKSKLTVSKLKQENQDLIFNVESKRAEFGKLVLELDKMKECFKFVNDELDVERSTVACLTLELESQRSELDHVRKIASDRELENCEIQEMMICEDLKVTFVKTQYETQMDELVKQIWVSSEKNRELEKKHLENEACYIKEFELLQMKINDTETRLNGLLESETHYIEESRNLATELESVKLELEASIAQNAEISVLKNERDLEVGQLKDMLTKLKVKIEQYNKLQMKFQDTESILKLCIENEARYIEENRNLATELESVRLELEASIAQNAEILVLKNECDIEVGQLKDMLTKSKVEIKQYNELQMKFQDSESRLKLHLENEARYIQENKKLLLELEYVKLELEASIAQNAEILKSNNENAFEIGQLKDMLTKSKAEIEQCSELQTKLQDTESSLKLCLENEACYIEKNRNLATELESVQMKINDTEARLNDCMSSEARYIEENRNLVMDLESVRLELKASIAQNAEISVLKNERDLEVDQQKDMLTKSKSEIEQYSQHQTKFQDTESRLKLFLENEARYIEENRNLATELESVRLELKASIAHNEEILELNKNNEDGNLFSGEESEIVLTVLKAKLDEQNDELNALQNKCSELTNKLSGQILKTEEFKNLSIYLKELKDNADVAREKKDPEGPSESLRVAFIKEQYQTKFQELKQQLSVSKKHNEEMLFKLQDALDEIESRKKTEAFQMKRIQELETMVELVISEKPDFDRIKAELECAVLSLECCKEEKEKLVVLLQACEDEKLKIVEEFSLIKEKLAQKEENGHMGENGSMENKDERSIQGVTERACEDEDNSLLNDSKQLMVVNDQFRTQRLRACMEQLEEELEKMKNDNSLIPLTNYDPSFQDLQREHTQLNEANEQLGSIYPNFIDFPGNGNALERVLALEIELAEALRSKKKSSIQLQSSFLKQHSDEEAIFKSFRDINELIKDMLEIKGKYVNVENELKEMHDRYSQLSLQFAEVEGERQKLMMTLKNARSSRNLPRLNRSSMAALEDQPL